VAPTRLRSQTDSRPLTARKPSLALRAARNSGADRGTATPGNIGSTGPGVLSMAIETWAPPLRAATPPNGWRHLH
jgi:hypothetical protein